MVTLLIVLGVIAFVAVDGYVLYRVFAARRSADCYGAFAIPGRTEVTLPAGKVRLTYQESYKAPRRGNSIDFGVPGGLDVTVISPAGEQVELAGPGFRGMGSSVSTGSGWSRALAGTAEVELPGAYTVSARLDPDGRIEPRILIGK